MLNCGDAWILPSLPLSFISQGNEEMCGHTISRFCFLLETCHGMWADQFSTEAWLTVSFLPKWKQSYLFSVLPLPLLLCTRSLPPSFPSQTHKDVFDILVSISPQSRHPHFKPRTAQGEFKSCLFLPLIWSVCLFLEVEFLMRTSNSNCVCIYIYFFVTDGSWIYHLLRPGDHWLK